MASALDRLQRRFSTQRRQSVASSISPSRDFRGKILGIVTLHDLLRAEVEKAGSGDL
jgi:CBS domain-containing protein